MSEVILLLDNLLSKAVQLQPINPNDKVMGYLKVLTEQSFNKLFMVRQSSRLLSVFIKTPYENYQQLKMGCEYSFAGCPVDDMFANNLARWQICRELSLMIWDGKIVEPKARK